MNLTSIFTRALAVTIAVLLAAAIGCGGSSGAPAPDVSMGDAGRADAIPAGDRGAVKDSGGDRQPVDAGPGVRSDAGTDAGADTGSPGTLTHGPADDCPGTAAPLPPRPSYASCVPGTTTEPLTILHLSDLHGHYHPYLDGHSPFAYVRAYADATRAATADHTLFLDAGDDYEKGSLAELASQGDATRHLLPYLRPDVRAIGNHDFAYGETEILRDIDLSPIPVLAANVTYSGTNPDDLLPSTILDVGCAKVGLFGLVTQPYDESDEQVSLPYLGDFSQTTSYVGRAQSTTNALRAAGADAVIAVTHLGASADHALVDNVTGLDLVAGGHDHNYFSTPYVGAAGGESADVGAYATWIGRFDVQVDLARRRIVFPPGSYTTLQIPSLPEPPDPNVDAEVQRMMRCFAPDWSSTVVYVSGAISPGSPGSFTPVFDAAIRSRFPDATAILYEAWPSFSVLKATLAGALSPQDILDAMFVEREMPGTPGFTSLYDMPISGAALSQLCAASLNTSLGPIHRACPDPATLSASGTYHLIVEKRDLYYPSYAFTGGTSFMPPPYAVPVPSGIESYAVMLAYARQRGAACQYLDTDSGTKCP